MARICPLTDSADLESVHTDISTTENFEYDANGNTIYNHNQEGFRKMYWDESNRLRVVNDNDHQIQHYIYDGNGERILKASSQIETVYENGQVDANTTTMGLYTTYVSPYMVVDANQKYSKHYFNGTQRVASKIGEQDITMFDTNNPYLKQANSKAAENTPSTDFDTLKNKQITDFSYYLSKSTNNATAKNVKVNYTEYKKADTNTETTSAKTADNNSAYAAPQYAELYYYHSDHLGTGTFLSDFDGNPYQFFLNLPFGETMAEQHSYSGDYTNRYKFNGKELDEETGFYYYGARYYNPKFSIWLSTDPLAEKYPSWSPYCYTMDNPINLIDPDGREVAAPPRNGIKQFIDNSGVYHWDASKKQYEHYAYTDSSREHYSFSGYYTVNSSSKAVGKSVSIDNSIPAKITEPKNNSTNNNSMISDFWNSPLTRLSVPDKISISLSTSVTAFAGVSEELSFNWITRGNDASFAPYVLSTTGVQGGLGISGDALIGVGVGYFATSDMRNLKKGDASSGLLGWSVYGSADVGAVVGGSATGSVGFSNKPFTSRPTWISGGLSVGASIGAAGTGGVSYSLPVFESQFKKD